MTDELIPYLKFNPKLGPYPTIELTSFPFPPDHIPEIFNLRFFLVEENQRGYYLRSTINSLFCCCLYEVEKKIEVPDFDTETMSYKYDEDGNVVSKMAHLQYLCFTIEGEQKVVAYSYEGKGKNYLHVHHSDVPFDKLDGKLKQLYLGAKLLTRQFITHMQNENKKHNTKTSGLEPKGEWEAQMFKDVFHSNPSSMSDTEYEMIFGVER